MVPGFTPPIRASANSVTPSSPTDIIGCPLLFLNVAFDVIVISFTKISCNGDVSVPSIDPAPSIMTFP